MHDRLTTLQKDLADNRDVALEQARRDATRTRYIQFVVAAVALLWSRGPLPRPPLGPAPSGLPVRPAPVGGRRRPAGADHASRPARAGRRGGLGGDDAAAHPRRARRRGLGARGPAAGPAAGRGGPRPAHGARPARGPGWSSAAALRPAEGLLAGDWYDVLPLADGRFAVVVADVSGHGARAGIVAIQLKRLLEAALHLAPEPDLALAMRPASSPTRRSGSPAASSWSSTPTPGPSPTPTPATPLPVVLRTDEESGGGVRVVTELDATGPLLSWLHLDVPGAWQTRTTSLAPGRSSSSTPTG